MCMAAMRARGDRVVDGAERRGQDLRVTYLDLYLMHWPLAFKPGRGGAGQIEPGTTLSDTWRAMEVGTPTPDPQPEHCATVGVLTL
jgi:diketogulonate reductase-like aldo/keto reductase